MKAHEYKLFCYDNIFDSTEERYQKYYLLVDSCIGFSTEYIQAEYALKNEPLDKIIEEFGDVCFFYGILENEITFLIKNEKDKHHKDFSLAAIMCVDFMRKFVVKKDIESLIKLNTSVKRMFDKLVEKTSFLTGIDDSELLYEAREKNVEKIKRRYGDKK